MQLAHGQAGHVMSMLPHQAFKVKWANSSHSLAVLSLHTTNTKWQQSSSAAVSKTTMCTLPAVENLHQSTTKKQE